MTLRGPDVSSAKQTQVIDWHAVAGSGAGFAIAKASEGVGFADPTLVRNWPAIKEAGLVRGAYHFSRPDLGNTAADEADYFLAQIAGDFQPGDSLVNDIERGEGDLSAWCLAWLQRVESKTGYRPWIYTGAYFAETHLTDARLGAYPLWLAAYQAVPPAPPTAWSRITLWQHTDAANYPGIAGCDESLFEGTVDQLRALGKDGANSSPAHAAVTTVSFNATPLHLPLGFYADAALARHLYDSQATPGTAIQFDAWMQGEGVTDPAAGQIDRRWYRRHNPGGQAGWTPSAWVNGNAPGSAP